MPPLSPCTLHASPGECLPWSAGPLELTVKNTQEEDGGVQGAGNVEHTVEAADILALQQTGGPPQQEPRRSVSCALARRHKSQFCQRGHSMRTQVYAQHSTHSMAQHSEVEFPSTLLAGAAAPPHTRSKYRVPKQMPMTSVMSLRQITMQGVRMYMCLCAHGGASEL